MTNEPSHDAGDAELVRVAQAGNPAAFGRLYERYFDKVYGYLAFKLGNTSDAEDAAEQVFLKALESLGGYRWTGTPFQAWLFRIAHNLVVDHLRRRARRPSAPLDDALPVPDEHPDADPETALARGLTRLELMDAMSQLTELQRQVIALKFAGERTNADVARLMGKSEGAVKALQHAGLASLNRYLTRKGRA